VPVTLGLVTAGAGLAQSAIGYFSGRKAKRELEGLQTPIYTPSKSISDYYNQALNRYQQSPYESNLYKMQAQNIARGTTQGLSALQDRRSALAGVPALVQNQNDAMLKAAAAAEQEQSQRFSQLGAASQAMAGEERQAFNINQMLPYQKKYDILSQKAAGNAAVMNAGLQNVYGGLSSAAFYKADPYGNKKNNDTNYYGVDSNLRPSLSMRTVNPQDYYNQ
jgi:hypothetical protein